MRLARENAWSGLQRAQEAVEAVNAEPGSVLSYRIRGRCYQQLHFKEVCSAVLLQAVDARPQAPSVLSLF